MVGPATAGARQTCVDGPEHSLPLAEPVRRDWGGRPRPGGDHVGGAGQWVYELPGCHTFVVANEAIGSLGAQPAQARGGGHSTP